nr:branchpoint-bridging protein [Quercus suber]
MRNHKFSQVSRNDIKENKTNQRLEEKAVLVSAGKCLPQSSSDRCYIANEPLEEDPEEERSEVEEDPEEKPSEVEEDPEEESVEEIGNKLEKEPRDDLEEDPEEDPIEELEEEPIKVLLEQIEEPSESKCHSGTDPNNSYKKRSLDASTGESVVLQGYQSQKKCRQEESLKPESESSYAAPHFHSQSGLAMTLGDKCSSEQQEGTGSSRKRRHSRWEKVENDQASKRKKTRWISDDLQLKLLGPLQLPDLGKEFVVGSDLDLEIQELQAELADINKKLQTSELHDDKPMEERSPSPEPVHDNLGIRLNPRQVRLHQKLVQKHQRIISKLIKKNSTFKPPLEYKSSKLCKKIYIPVKEYPDYNFVGLIISPLGKTQKRMEKETGAKIRLRGKDKTTNPQKNDEDLHVYIEADNQKSLDAAVGMVEKLLNPIDDAMNEHKRVQLEELATLKANMCRICHEHGHHYFACPQRQSTFKMVCCDKCGSYKHPTETCGVIAMSPQSKSGQGSGSSLGSTTKTQDRPNKEIDNTNLYVNHLPENVDDNRLLEFFCPFGKITKARVIRNQTTRISKGYGFVKFENQIDAAAAMAHLNGCRMDGHTLAVRIAGVPPGSLFLSHLSPYQGPPPIFPNVTSQIAWPGWIPGSILPVPLTPVPISNGMNLHSSSIFVEHGNVLKSEGLGFTPASALSSLSDLPGCSSLHSSSNSSNQIQSSSDQLFLENEKLNVACQAAWDSFLKGFSKYYAEFQAAVQALATLDCLHSLSILCRNKVKGYS